MRGLPDHRHSRRHWLRQLAGVAAAARLGTAATPQETAVRRREFPFPELSGYQTPNHAFFLRSHFDYPRISPEGWNLTVEGLVKKKLRICFDELVKLPSITRAVTFECSGNPPGGGMVSNAEWRGIPLALLLERAGIEPGVKELVFDGADCGLDEHETIPLSYARSVSLARALSPDALVVWEMNGEPLSAARGFPVRLVVAGTYATSHVKWLTRIRAIDHEYKGFYMTKRYITARRLVSGGFEITPVIDLKLKSQIARPADRELVSSPTVLVAGAAWSGAGSISRVEVSTDNGVEWHETRILDKPAASAWVRWQYLWQPPSSGAYTLVCRAFDTAGGSQPREPDGTEINRYGNNWYHRVVVTVRRA